MNQTIEQVAIDEEYVVTMITTELLPGVKLVTCEGEREATLMINDADIQITYTEELASIISNIRAYTAEQFLMKLVNIESYLESRA